MDEPLPAMHHTILGVDVEGYGSRRANLDQLRVRDGLYSCLRVAFARSEIPWDACYYEDRGDGAVFLIPPQIPKEFLVSRFVQEFCAALRLHNDKDESGAGIRARLVVHAGEVHRDSYGVAGSAINFAFRLLEAVPLKQALANSSGVLAVIVSPWFFNEVIQHVPDSEPASYRQVWVSVKETETIAWIRRPDDPYPPLQKSAGPTRQPGVAVPRQLPAAVSGFTGRKRGLEAVALELDQLADLLAGAVRNQWTRAAADRGLLQSEPIPVRWRRTSRPVAGPVSAAVGSQRFPPLPGLPAVSQQRLRRGRISDLHALYGGLGSGRLVIAGAPGSGKSGAAVLLVLAALKHRERVSDAERLQVPVPVMFTLHGWDPHTQRVSDWLATRLQQTYSLFAGKGGARKAAGLLADGKVAVILDGLDEIHEQLRPVALRALNQQADFRLVILTRSIEMAAAARWGLLEGAAALELQDIDPVTAAGYLARVQTHPAPPGWRELTDWMRRVPDSPIAQALSSPLTLTLVRDTYRSGDDIREFLDYCNAADRLVSREDIVDHLLDRVLPAAYAKRPGDPPLRYDLETAQHTLRCLAARMNQDATRDLLWWRIRDWAPAAPRIIATGLVFGLGIGIAAGLTIRPLFGVAAGLASVLGFGLLIGLRDSSLSQMGPRLLRELFRPSSIPGGLAVGLPAGLAAGLATGLMGRLAIGLASGIAFGLAVGLAGWLSGLFSPHAVDKVAPYGPRTSWNSSQAAGLTAGLTAGLMSGLAFGLAGGLEGALAVGLEAGLAAGLAVWRTAVLAVGLTIGLTAGLTIGLAVSLAVGLTGGHAIGLAAGLTVGLTAGLVFGPAGGLMYTRTWSARLAFAQLAARWRTPIRLMRFLEDARDRDVLRTVGPVYQFRHARLQDRLAEQALAASQGSASLIVETSAADGVHGLPRGLADGSPRARTYGGQHAPP
jgi:hypothetical protein